MLKNLNEGSSDLEARVCDVFTGFPEDGSVAVKVSTS